jgi:outer membrane protein OmpA-like peptidoglycan-associated protein
MEETAAPPKLPPLSGLEPAPEKSSAKENGNKSLPAMSSLTGDDNTAKETPPAKMAANVSPASLPPLPTEKPELPPLPPLEDSKSTAPATTPAAPAKPDATTKETQVASLPSSTEAPSAASTPASGPPPDLRITFNESETEVPLSQTSQLDKLVKTLSANPDERVTIMAYASGPETSGVFPKRVSLARGIAVRNYLTTTKGIDIERVNVKALGNKNAGGPGDRVDVFILK